MKVRYLAFAAALAAAPAAYATAAAQSASEHVAMGDQAHDALNAAEAAKHYEAAVAADSTNYEALWKAARELVDLAEFDPNKDTRTQHYRQAEQFARRAVAANPNDAEGHFHLARAIGRVALTLGAKDRVKYGKEVRAQALEALKHDPKHPGALHVMGRWNAEIMRLSGFERFFAKNFLGGRVLGSASWGNARRYMERAVEVDPERLAHHLDLGDIYADIGERAKAREQYEIVVRGAAIDYNDPSYKRQAADRLSRLR